MKLIYNTLTDNILPWPRIDYQSIIGLEPHLLEMDVVQQQQPVYNNKTQQLQPKQVVDVINKTITKTWDIVEKLEEQIEPILVTPRQIRLALIQGGIDLAAIDAAVSNNQVAKVEWEYASYVNRNHPLVEQLGQQLGLSAAQIDALFSLAQTL